MSIRRLKAMHALTHASAKIKRPTDVRPNEERDEKSIALVATDLEQADGDGARVTRGASVDEMTAALATEAAEEEQLNEEGGSGR